MKKKNLERSDGPFYTVPIKLIDVCAALYKEVCLGHSYTPLQFKEELQERWNKILEEYGVANLQTVGKFTLEDMEKSFNAGNRRGLDHYYEDYALDNDGNEIGGYFKKDPYAPDFKKWFKEKYDEKERHK